jgi:hypothetical protein
MSSTRTHRAYVPVQRLFEVQPPASLVSLLQALLVFDVSDRSSFTALEEWLTEARDFGAKKMTIVVCGNKVTGGVLWQFAWKPS